MGVSPGQPRTVYDADKRSHIYVCGGGESMYRGAACLRSVERYDPLVKTWRAAPEMLEVRCVRVDRMASCELAAV